MFLLAAILLSLPAAAYTPDPSPVVEIADTLETGAATLILETVPSGADIRLDRVFIGRTPHIQRGVAPGIHVLRFELAGHRPRELVLDLSERRTYTIRVTLVRRTGRLSVTVKPPDARIQVDGAEITGFITEVPAGLRTVRAYRFGYEEAVQSVFVPEDGIASAAFVLTPSRFTLSELRLRRPAFNPTNVGPLGTAEFRFDVTSFGRAELELRDPSGARAALLQVPPFSERLQTVVWVGRDEFGRPLADGEYSAELQVFPDIPGAAGPEDLVRRASVR
ncbi:MAG TPA: PEGA domain-containing protein, partial [Magnetospirillaceae bacterium]|nr:PEGA domain-containing protein [Magnetospirillaceae bacterium]